MWARTFDDALTCKVLRKGDEATVLMDSCRPTCPLRAFYSISSARSAVPYKDSAMETQKKIITTIKKLLRGEASVYADPGERGFRTGSKPLRLCAKLRDEEASVCGRPDLVAVFANPMVILIVEVVQTHELWKYLGKTFARLAFYAQGVHHLFGLPVSVALTNGKEALWAVMNGDCLTDALERLKAYQDFEGVIKIARRMQREGLTPCGSCGYQRICPLSDV